MLTLKSINKFQPLVKPATQRVLLQQKINVRFGSTETGQQNDSEHYEETFKSVWWKRSLFAVVGLYAWSKFDQIFFSEGDHPITRWIEYHQETEEESKAKQIVLLKTAQERARIRLLELEPQKLGFKRITSPDLFTRASQHGIEPGSQIDLSDMEIKF